MSWFLTAVGIALLVLLHEAGHFTAAKAVGMRVERFSLFFPPLLLRHRRGETEYAIGAVPLGGYVKITGMNPAERIPPAVAHRAYYRQPVWKRVVVIAAGPAVNIALAFLILVGIYVATGTPEPPPVVGRIEAKSPAASGLRPGDAILAVDGRRLSGDLGHQMDTVQAQVSKHRGTEVAFTLRRAGATTTVRMIPFYDAALHRWRIGFGYNGDANVRPAGPVRASGLALAEMWRVTSGTVSRIAQIFKPEERKQINSIVGGYEYTRNAFNVDTTFALELIAILSLSLGVVNLFPFLPLDGGHIFWALAEKVRGRAIPFSVMERAGFVGFVLVIGLFLIGFTNDLDRIAHGGFR